MPANSYSVLPRYGTKRTGIKPMYQQTSTSHTQFFECTLFSTQAKVVQYLILSIIRRIRFIFSRREADLSRMAMIWHKQKKPAHGGLQSTIGLAINFPLLSRDKQGKGHEHSAYRTWQGPVSVQRSTKGTEQL